MKPYLILCSFLAMLSAATAHDLVDPTDLHGDAPQLHIIAIDKDGDLDLPTIQKDGQDITHWSPDAYDVSLTKFASSYDIDQNLKSQEATREPKKYGGAYLRAMMDAIKARKRALGNRDLKIVIHIHGGMNAIVGAVQSAAHGYWIMEKQDPTIYPIFVCWNSEPLSCYWDHLCFGRSGVSIRDTAWEPVGYLSAPIFFLGDVGAGLARTPSIAIEQGISDFRTVSPQIYPENLNYVPMFERLKSRVVHDKKNKSIHVTEGADVFDDLDGAWNAIKYTATLPLKGIAGGVINGLGPGAWAEMKRRVDLMFWKQEQFLTYFDAKSNDTSVEHLDKIAAKQRKRLGALAWFLRTFREQVLAFPEGGTGGGAYQQRDILVDKDALKMSLNAWVDANLKDKKTYLSAEDFDAFKAQLSSACIQTTALNGKGYDITLIGHSMGAIVINEMLENNPDIPYHKIVFMAAACPVKDFQDMVIPYLESNPKCQFYNLCLNPEAELRNIEMYEVAPRGGLLNWINDIFENPPDMRHRMYGQYITSINTSDIIPAQVRGRVFMKAFGFGDHPSPDCKDPHFQEGFPHNHGEFNSFGTSVYGAFTGGKDGEELPVDFNGARPVTENPHGFWTTDFIWYNPHPATERGVNPLTLLDEKNPDREPGAPVYLPALDPSWTKLDGTVNPQPCVQSSKWH